MKDLDVHKKVAVLVLINADNANMNSIELNF